MSTQSQITQTQVLDAISRAALMLERQDAKAKRVTTVAQ